MSRHTRWGPDAAHVLTEVGYHRALEDGTIYRAVPGDDESVELFVDGDAVGAERDFSHRVGEALDPAPVDALGRRVPEIGEQRRVMPGYRPPLVRSPLESLITSITAQQVNLTWAATTRRRLVQTYGVRRELDGVALWQFPTADRLATLSVPELRELQFTTAKSEYIIAVARAGLDGVLAGLDALDDREVIERVTAIRGIGRWSADWLLARCLGRPAAIAAGDLAVRKVVSRIILDADEVVPEAAVREAVADWGDGGNWGMHLLLERLAE